MTSVIPRRAFLGALIGGLLTAPPTVAAQPAAKTPRIGYLTPSLSSNPGLRESFRQGLRDLGYVEGKNVLIEYRDAEGKDERLPALAAELTALKVDLIVTNGGTLAALAAQRATSSVPIVFVAVGDPVSSGLVTSLARPGGNVTGLSVLFPELIGKCLELLKQAVPGVSRVAILQQRAAIPERAQEHVVGEAEVAARTLRVQPQFVWAQNPGEIDRAFSDVIKARADALAVLSTPMFASERRRLVNLAAKNRLPTVYSFSNYVEAGGLMSYGPSTRDQARRAATYVDKILKGAKPADLPVEQPTTFELVVNLKTAKALGLTIPQSLLARADEVIQ